MKLRRMDEWSESEIHELEEYYVSREWENQGGFLLTPIYNKILEIEEMYWKKKEDLEKITEILPPPSGVCEIKGGIVLKNEDILNDKEGKELWIPLEKSGINIKKINTILSKCIIKGKTAFKKLSKVLKKVVDKKE